MQSVSCGSNVNEFGSSGYGHSGSRSSSVVVLLVVVVGTVIVEVIMLLLVVGTSVVVVVEFLFSHPACSG